jgi:hypothetical protein
MRDFICPRSLHRNSPFHEQLHHFSPDEATLNKICCNREQTDFFFFVIKCSDAADVVVIFVVEVDDEDEDEEEATDSSGIRLPALPLLPFPVDAVAVDFRCCC